MRTTVAQVITALLSVFPVGITATTFTISQDQWSDGRPQDYPEKIWQCKVLMQHKNVKEVTIGTGSGETEHLKLKVRKDYDEGKIRIVNCSTQPQTYMLCDGNYNNRWLRPQTIHSSDEHVIDWTYGHITIWFTKN
jgi:hypothetical protein